MLPIRTPKKLPNEYKFNPEINVEEIILPIAIEFANERCFSENHIKLNFVGIKRINVCAKAHKNCPKIDKLFRLKKQFSFIIYQSSVSQIALAFQTLAIY
jgi:hypothetical protein